MSFVTLAEAKLHLRVDGTDEDARRASQTKNQYGQRSDTCR